VAAAHHVLDAAGISPEYLELRDAETLQPVVRVERDALLAVAAHVGAARLIDNHVLSAAGSADTDPDVAVPDAVHPDAADPKTTEPKGDA
jgi:pantoate--beta-alanine ligase